MKKTAIFFCVILFLNIFSQTAHINVDDEVMRDGPNGKKIGTLMKNAEIEQIGKEGNWVKVSVQGWVWKQAVEFSQVEEKETDNAADKVIESVSPLAFEIIKTQPVGEQTTEVQVKIKNVSSKTINMAEVTCKAMDKAGETIEFKKQMVIKRSEGGLLRQDETYFTFLLDVDYYLVESFSFRLGTIEYK